MSLPFVDLSFQNLAVAEDVRLGLDQLIERGDFVLGSSVSEFESAYADFCGVRQCIGVGNGTDALEFALRALDVGPGDEVILPANTFIASALAVVRAGARPVLVDTHEAYPLIAPEAVAQKISSRTKAIMAVDLFGQIPESERLEALAAEAGLALVEDAAQAQGALRHGRRAGSFGDVSGTSFYPAKNLGAWGDGGAVTTRSEELADRLRSLRNYGSQVKYQHDEVGFNSRLDTLQALVLLAKLKRLEGWNELRREAASRYSTWLADLPGVRKPKVLEGNEAVWHIYAIRVEHRDRVLAHLNEAGIGAMIHYPRPIHLQPAFENLGHVRGDFPNTESASDEMISLPLFPGMTVSQQEKVVRVLGEALASIGG
ncbi:MAG: erythromycin biosynthesis sensory transduction protein eryC1 [Deltaproteobacteria bacterium]|nr:erythromycin biosynthesis sensory transduction protein eryC1 [Deltaproteobacteria bacterium]